MTLLRSLLNKQADRQAKTRKDGSPPYVWRPAAIVAAAISQIDLDRQFPASTKYAPLDWCEVVNNDAVDLTLTLNGVENWEVPAGTIRTVGRDEQIGIHAAALTNNDAVNPTVVNLVVVTFRKQAATADSLARRLGL